MCVISPAKTPVVWVSRASAKTPFCVVVVPVRSTRNAVVSLSLWSFRYKRCMGQATPVDGRLMTQVTVGREKFEVVSSFCYIRDCLSSGCCCISHHCRGRVNNSCVSSAMLHASETRPQSHLTCIACNAMTQSHMKSCPCPPWENLDRSDRYGLSSAGSNWHPSFRQKILQW